jgi:hypothetical protein
MTKVSVWLDERWNWRISGHFRLGSLLSAWALVLAVGLSPVLLLLLASVRTAASIAQSVLNIRLGRSQPVAPTDRIDWMMIAAIFAGGEVLAALHEYQGVAYSLVTLLPLLVPFSLLQVRMCLRSYRAIIPPTMIETAIIRLEHYARLETKAA